MCPLHTVKDLHDTVSWGVFELVSFLCILLLYLGSYKNSSLFQLNNRKVDNRYVTLLTCIKPQCQCLNSYFKYFVTTLVVCSVPQNSVTRVNLRVQTFGQLRFSFGIIVLVLIQYNRNWLKRWFYWTRYKSGTCVRSPPPPFLHKLRKETE